MKLNNKGWGTMEMLLLSGCLLVALLVAIFFISRLYGSLDNALGSKEYVDLENRLEVAGRNYIEQNNIEVSEEYRISLDILQDNGLIDELKDDNGNSCDGYVSISSVDNINYYNGYISCKSYETKNY